LWLVPAAIEADGFGCRQRARVLLRHSLAEAHQLIERREGSIPALNRIGLQPAPVLDRYEHGEWAMVAFHDEPLASGRRIEDLAKPSAHVERRDRSHSQASYRTMSWQFAKFEVFFLGRG
jgi:hypothetical protein